ncbi:MAG TPA: ATP-grasp domain-containing protein [Methyloprofundus sp.]|uniref:ATP-grasp domain-containing protein n=1 Tax=Methyloprofundus sp. TaxID=2020875 RepID=UPI0017E37576|nr:ATP-grasp domain-containing protein [Methyloprofundus sp.]HIG65021.1 ATP-grasp domain-containing protein [Methyloprofundus sp.]HIL77617.1 ATP-grasp domain-containing protein [Methylococcales bacterium]
MPGVRETSGLKSALQSVLIVANSGRMLANAVRSAGYQPLVIDLFADQDTQAIAERVWQVEELSLVLVQKAVESLLLTYKIQWIVYGSGLENFPETFEYLAGCSVVMGNDFSVIQRLHAKKTFFKQLDALDIPYPAVRFYPPGSHAGWLIKPTYHAGGVGIRYCDRVAGENEYYQKFCPGEAGSVLFCADGEQFDIIGFHRQWTLAEDDFTFAGIIKEACIPEELQRTVHKWLDKLVRFYHLQGLASLDFIYNAAHCYFLEINPRPPASMMLYPEFDLFGAHRTGRFLKATEQKTIRALQIVYAKEACVIPSGIKWPQWSYDKPKYTTSIQIGAPICSIMAHGKTVQQVLARLQAKQIKIEEFILNR